MANVSKGAPAIYEQKWSVGDRVDFFEDKKRRLRVSLKISAAMKQAGGWKYQAEKDGKLYRGGTWFEESDMLVSSGVFPALAKNSAYAKLKSGFGNSLLESFAPRKKTARENEIFEDRTKDIREPAMPEVSKIPDQHILSQEAYRNLVLSRKSEIVARVMEGFKKMVGSDSEHSERSEEASSESGSHSSYVSLGPSDGNGKRPRKPEGGQSSSGQSSTDFSPRKQQKSNVNHSVGLQENEGNEDNDSQPPKSGTLGPKSVDEKRRLACHYQKKYPVTSETPSSCVHPGFKGINRLKDHLFRVHCRRLSCDFCLRMFNEQDEFIEHLRQRAASHCCPDFVSQAETHFNSGQEKEIKAIGKSLPEEEKWRVIWKILFARDGNTLENIPSPYFGEEELVQHDSFRREMLPQLVEQHVERIVQVVLERITSMVPEITRNILEENSYGSQSTNLIGTSARPRNIQPTDRDLPAHVSPSPTTSSQEPMYGADGLSNFNFSEIENRAVSTLDEVLNLGSLSSFLEHPEDPLMWNFGPFEPFTTSLAGTADGSFLAPLTPANPACATRKRSQNDGVIMEAAYASPKEPCGDNSDLDILSPD